MEPETAAAPTKRPQKTSPREPEGGLVPSNSIDLDETDPHYVERHAYYKFVHRFLKDVDNVKTLLKENESNHRGRKTKPKEVPVPVINTMMIKKIIEDDGKLYLLSTMIQRVYGLGGGENDKSMIEEEETPFDYRFNDQSPDDGQLELRRYEYHAMPVENRKVDICVSRFIFNGTIPLSVVAEFDRFPFTIFRAEVRVELSTRSDTLGKSLRLRPNLLLHDERRNNISIQAPPEFEEQEGKKLVEAFISKVTLDKLDASDTYSMISPYPEIAYEYDTKKDYCPRFRIAFYLNEDAIPKFIRIQLPMLLVAAINTFNYMIAHRSGDDNADDLDDADRYLQTSAALGLTAVFVLPEMARRHNVTRAVTWNEMNVLLIFFSLALSSIPPTFVIREVSLAGVVLLWLSFIIPFYNLTVYYMARNRIHANRIQTVKECQKHPFVQTPDFEQLKEAEEELLHSLSYVEKTEGPVSRKSFLYQLQHGGRQSTASVPSCLSKY